MHFPKEFKIEKITDPKAGNPFYRNLWLDVENKTITATNGVGLVRIPVKCDKEDISGWIPAEAVAAARKEDRSSPDVLLLADKAVFVCNARYERPDIGTPPFDQVIPKPYVFLTEKRKQVPVQINPKILAKVSDAIGADVGVMIYTTGIEWDPFFITTRPIVGESRENPFGNCEAFGVLMPVRM